MVACKTAAGSGVNVALAVSANMQQSSLASALTFSQSVLSSISSSNSPSSGSVSITVFGAMFGSVGFSAATRLVDSVSTKSASSFQNSVWRSDSSIVGKNSYGYGKNSFVVSAGKQASLFAFPAPASLTWDVVTIQRLTNATIPSTGAVSVQVVGFSMGSRSICNVVVIGASSSQSSVWVSDSILRVKVSHGLSNQASASVSVFRSVTFGSLSNAVTFGLPDVVVVIPKIAPKSGSVSVTVQARSFGMASVTSFIKIGSTSSLSSSWRSDSSVTVKVPSVSAINVAVASTVARQASVLSTAMSFDAHRAIVAAQNSPTTGSISMSVVGVDFGSWDFTSAFIRHDKSSAMASLWTSASAVRCNIASGVGQNIGIFVSVRRDTSFLNFSVSYDVSVVSSASPSNVATTSSISLTIVGSGFGVAAMSSRFRISGTASRGEFWASDSSVVGRISHVGISGPFESIVASVAVQFGSLGGLVSFDKPASAAMAGTCNAPASGASSLTIIGLAFGEVRYSPKAALSSSQTEAMRWTSSSSIAVKISRSLFMALKDAVISIGSRVGSVSSLHSFDVPSLSSIGTNLVASTGSNSVTVVGVNMGSFSGSMKLVLGGSVSSVSVWKSDSNINGKLVRGAGRSLDAVISSAVDAPRSRLLALVSYSPPKISSSLNTNVPKTGSVSVTISGSGFASYGVSSSLRMHDTAPDGSFWTSDSCIAIKVAAGSSFVHVVASIYGASSSSSNMFSYNRVALSSSSPTNAPASGSLSVSVLGKSYAHVDYSRSMLSFANTASECVNWISDSSTVAKIPQGVRNSLTVKVSMNAVVNSITGIFSHDIPSALDLQPAQIPASGASLALIAGLGLGYASHSQKAVISGSSCALTGWQSDSSLRCKIISGSERLLSGTVVVTSGSLVSKPLNMSVSFDVHVILSFSTPQLSSSGSQRINERIDRESERAAEDQNRLEALQAVLGGGGEPFGFGLGDFNGIFRAAAALLQQQQQQQQPQP